MSSRLRQSALAGILGLVLSVTLAAPGHAEDHAPGTVATPVASSTTRDASGNVRAPASPPTTAKPKAPKCRNVLPGVRSGKKAVDELGSKIDIAAADAGMSVSHYSRTLKQDPTFRVDRCGKTFVQEPAPPAPPDGNEASATANGASIQTVPSDVFALSSRPGSNRTIYLDFDGATITGTGWNAAGQFNMDPINAVGYSLDGDYATFSPTEQANIYQIWQSVSEDFSSFDVNVTTAVPASGVLERTNSQDTVFGTKALITNTTAIGGGSGGIAFLASFDATNSAYYQPAFVFQQGLGNNTKAIAEAASHEVGHNLGLEHAGTIAHDAVAANGYYQGQGAWAPIMGASYYRPVTQFSSGEYQYSNNNQDDYAVIATNGLQQIADDYGATLAGATALSSGTPLSGVIASPTDVDAFTFTASGATTVDVTPAEVAPDLDTRLRIYDGTQALVATIDPAVAMTNASTATGLGATYSFTATPGTYYATVDGTGFGDPLTNGYSNYGSRGRYSVSLSTTPLGAVSVSTTQLSEATVGVPYNASLASTGGTAPVTWTKESGNLPPGVSLASDGTLSGTPTTAGTYSAVFRVTDAAAQTAVSGTLTINTYQPLLAVSTPSLTQGQVGTPYSVALSASGGSGGYSWTVASGSLPQGVSLSSNGTISGTPQTAGSYTASFQVTDSVGHQATTASTGILINAAPSSGGSPPPAGGVTPPATSSPLRIASVLTAKAKKAKKSRVVLAASGGSGGYRWAAAARPPAGVAVSATGSVSIKIKKKGTYRVKLLLTDSGGGTSSGVLIIKVK